MALTLFYFNVGQGDSILIKTPSNKIGIIDSSQINEKIPALDYIQNNDVKRIEFICMTHPHRDHYKGMLELLEYCEKNKIPVNKFCDPPLTPKDLDGIDLPVEEHDYFFSIYEKKIAMVKDLPSRIQLCSSESLIFEEPDLRIMALAPFKTTVDKIVKEKFINRDRVLNEKYNYSSIVILIEYKEHNILLLSDSPKSEQKILLNSNRRLDKRVDNFKLSHHGSKHYYLPRLVEDFQKKSHVSAIISAGCWKDMPSSDVLRILSSHNVSTYCTNAWDAKKKSDGLKLTGISPQFNSALESITKPVYNFKKIKPYHGNITIEFKDGGNSILTETNKKPL